MKFLFFSLLLCGFSAQGFAALPPAPNIVDQQSFTDWLGRVGAVVSPFSDPVFSWYSAQLKQGLPREVTGDPEQTFVSVDVPLRETIELEERGDIDRGTTIGMEIYSLVDAPISIAFDALMFRWGKPLGVREGTTYPEDYIFGKRSEKIEELFGPLSYKCTSARSKGGIAKDLNDFSILLVRGSNETGWTFYGNFWGPNGQTTTTSSITLVYLKPVPGGKTEFRLTSRHIGQSYLSFGIEFGRKNFGFNRERIRQGQREYLRAVHELKTTGKVPERPSN